MTKDQLVDRAKTLISLCSGRAEPQHVLAGALTLLGAVYGEQSQQVKALLKRRDDIADMKAMEDFKKIYLTDAVRGVLDNMVQELDMGLLSSLERRIASDGLADFIKLAREALSDGSDGAKNVGAVLAAAAFEDTLRRMATVAGTGAREKLSDTITDLKDAGMLAGPQVGIAQSY